MFVNILQLQFYYFKDLIFARQKVQLGGIACQGYNSGCGLMFFIMLCVIFREGFDGQIYYSICRCFA